MTEICTCGHKDISHFFENGERSGECLNCPCEKLTLQEGEIIIEEVLQPKK